MRLRSPICRINLTSKSSVRRAICYWGGLCENLIGAIELVSARSSFLLVARSRRRLSGIRQALQDGGLTGYVQQNVRHYSIE